MQVSVLITDGENRSSLAAVRSLGNRGYRVVVAGKNIPCLASVSKLSSRAYRVPDPAKDPVGCNDAVLNIVTRENIDIVFPMTDLSVTLLNRVREKFPAKTTLACPPAEKTAKVADKAALFRLAETWGVAVPKTFYLSGAQDLAREIQKIKSYPVVVKPARSVVAENGEVISGGVRYAGSPLELESIYSSSRILQYPSMIQEKITGPGTGLFTLYDKDRHLALFSHRRVREKPPSGGVSVVSESVVLDPEMVEYAGRLLSEVKWQGVAMVEFKRDIRDGKPRLMEINGRFWGTLQLAIACGVDFPALLADKILGKNSGVQPGSYKVGHKLKWILGTLDHLVIRLKNDSRSLNLPPDAPSRLGAIRDFLKIREKNCSFDVFDKKDLRPFLHEIKDYAGSIIK
ncbi:putative ATP-grasp superfamily ATP-dependent carboligase [Desulfosalsimonas propionicica]|uniref:Putative ATP-grasp superfamily ATP-dependent carboligase n=1 Tax=Desulfosalsimonas propionicica TaxID=332175 RepID=A0A7W0CC28_9BACT|nr:ATP-grasp domain-containing protein [Desulfosalsimonas propionicica]MBA2883001.1 putative ATP-grasp superfamily ATP-dependent carboligase [Desulfosalsimonas propionicica]